MNSLSLQLTAPVRTLDQIVLMPAGAVVTPESLAAMKANHPRSPSPAYRLLECGTVRQNLREVAGLPNYEAIFSNRERTAGLMELLAQVEVTEPILQSLEYFKELDSYTYGHVLRVYLLSCQLATLLVPDFGERTHESISLPTHDIGKVCVPLSILQKPEPLSKSEYQQLKHHAMAGFVLLSHYLDDVQNAAAQVALGHHERRDGSGYPQGLHTLGLLVEIVVVCDIYDALISPRPYRPVSYDNRSALEELTRMAENGQIGWEVLKALVYLVRKQRGLPADIQVSVEKRGAPPPGNVYGVFVDD